jgi:hypothetical protein
MTPSLLPRCAAVGAVGLLALLPLSTPAHAAGTAKTATAPYTGPLVITPTGGGARDGSSVANAGTLADLPKLVKLRPAGGQVLVRSDLGVYKVSSPIIVTAGGASGAPVVVRGTDAQGNPARPVINGTRTAPYSPTGTTGSEVFRLMAGANNLTFQDLAFTNQGNGVFRIGGDLSALTLQSISATNVYRFLEDNVSGTATTASATGLTVRDVTVTGFSREAIRLADDTHDVLIEDVVGDSQGQSGDDFAIGVHLEDTVHDVTLNRVRMDNAVNRSGSYWNGDGFATERGVSDVRFVDTSASGSTDAGYDVKSSSTTLVRAKAADNKRNFRFWATDTTVEDCTGSQPRTRGGSGSQDQVWLNAGAVVTMTGCTFADSSPSSIAFSVDDGAALTVSGGSVTQAGTLAYVAKTGTFMLTSPTTSAGATAAKPLTAKR